MKRVLLLLALVVAGDALAQFDPPAGNGPEVDAIAFKGDAGVLGSLTVGPITSTVAGGSNAVQMNDLAKIAWSNTNISGNGTTLSASSNGAAVAQFDRTGPVNNGVAGTGLTTINFSGLLTCVTAPVSSSGAANLQTYAMPASTLTSTGRCLQIYAAGTGNDTNAKTVTLAFGGQTVMTKALAAAVGTWKITAIVCRTGSSTQEVDAEGFNSGGTTVAQTDGATVLWQYTHTAGTQTESAGITIKTTASVATTTGVTSNLLCVGYL